MRQTCARVLAAALMTGAIAAVLALPALFDSPRDEGRELTAPPSSLQRSVRVPALPAPARPVRAERLVTALSVSRSAVRPTIVRHEPSRSVVRAPRSNPRPATAGPPAPKAPEPESREIASTTPEPEAQPPAQTPSAPACSEPVSGKDKSKGKGKGKARGRNKDNERAPDPEKTPVPAAVAEASSPPGNSEPPSEADQSKDDGNAHGRGHRKRED
jgi:hypothetical protein